jgi:hypothetical protein
MAEEVVWVFVPLFSLEQPWSGLATRFAWAQPSAALPSP